MKRSLLYLGAMAIMLLGADRAKAQYYINPAHYYIAPATFQGAAPGGGGGTYCVWVGTGAHTVTLNSLAGGAFDVYVYELGSPFRMVATQRGVTSTTINFNTRGPVFYRFDIIPRGAGVVFKMNVR